MFNKIKRYISDDYEKARKDLVETVASLLYEVARDECMDVLHYGTVFIVEWAKPNGTGLDVTFGSCSPKVYDEDCRTHVKSVKIEEELQKQFKDSAVTDLKARGVQAFSNACTFIVINALNVVEEKLFIPLPPLNFFPIPSTQHIVRGQSKAYTEAVKSGNQIEQVRLVRSATNGGKKQHLYIKASLTFVAANNEKDELSKHGHFDFYESYPGLIR